MEKKLFVMAAAIMMATASANAQEERVVDAYFTADEMPDMRLFMPGPPDSTSVAFANDVSRCDFSCLVLQTALRWLSPMT